MLYTSKKILFNNKEVEKFIYPNHPVRCITTGPSENGKSIVRTNSLLNIINEYDEIYIYSPSLHQYLDQKLIKRFNKFIPIHIIPNILNEKDIDLVIDEIVTNTEFEESDTEKETYESIEASKTPEKYDDGGNILTDDLNEKEMNDPRVQAVFKRSGHNMYSIFMINQDYYEFSKRTIRANGNIYHIFKTNNFLDVRNINQEKASMDMTLDEFEYLASTCWNAKYQPLTIDVTRDKFTSRYRLGLNSLVVPNSFPF